MGILRQSDMDISTLPLLIFLAGAAIPFVVLAHAAADTARAEAETSSEQ